MLPPPPALRQKSTMAETSIELVMISEDGVVQSVHDQTVFGMIKDLAILRWNSNCRVPDPQMFGKDLLVVLSDSGKLSFLSFCNEMHRFVAVSHIQLSGPGNSRHQLGRMLAVDSKFVFFFFVRLLIGVLIGLLSG